MRWLAAAAVLALLGTAERTAAQGEPGAACVLDRARATELERLPRSELIAYWDSAFRADSAPRPGYAAGQPWFTPPVTITFGGYQRLNPYGLPRFIEPHLLRRVGEHEGVDVYIATNEWWRVEVIYLPVRPGCVFQPYMTTHWGMPCSYFGCPFALEEAPPGTTCRLRGDELAWVREDEEAGPPVELATSRRWYAADQPITFREHRFRKMGLPRQLPPGSVRRIGEVGGVGVYIAPEGFSERVWGFYVPVRAGCEFQLYEDEAMFQGVRGD